MARITREQYNKWNAQAQNGFSFDLAYFMTWNDKRLTKQVPADDGCYYKVDITYTAEFEKITNEHGVSYNRETGRQVPTVWLSFWKPSTVSGCYSSWGLGIHRAIGEPQPKKNYKTLCSLSGSIDTDKLIQELTDGEKLKLNDGRIL